MPAKGPFSTTDTCPSTAEISQLSPILFLVVYIPLKGAIFSPPHTISLR